MAASAEDVAGSRGTSNHTFGDSTECRLIVVSKQMRAHRKAQETNANEIIMIRNGQHEYDGRYEYDRAMAEANKKEHPLSKISKFGELVVISSSYRLTQAQHRCAHKIVLLVAKSVRLPVCDIRCHRQFGSYLFFCFHRRRREKRLQLN